MLEKQNAPVKLLDFDKESLEKWLSTFDVVLTDCDGTLWHHQTAIPFVPEVIGELQEKFGKRVILITNNGTKTRHEIWESATRMGFKIEEESQLIAPAFSIAQYLNSNHSEMLKSKKVYVIGMESIGKELDVFGIQHFGIGSDIVRSISDIELIAKSMIATEEVGAVVVAFDEHFSYGKLLRASNFLIDESNNSHDCIFLTTNSDAVHKYTNYHIPGTGAILSAVETSTGRRALELGKPNPMICEDLLRKGIIEPSRTLMIGDSCKIDVKFGKNCGFSTLLVGTGQDTWDTTLSEMLKTPTENADYIPDFYLPSLADLLDRL